jgi:hypothetical protein
MYIFGGYVNGSKANDLWVYDFEKKTWEELDKGDFNMTEIKQSESHNIERPKPRVGSAIIFFQNSIYLFGGHDEDNEKLDDFWKYDLATNKWSEINPEGLKPTGRNGHTMVIINNKIVLFGGILEITKESDEVFIYDLSTNTWKTYEAPS